MSTGHYITNSDISDRFLRVEARLKRQSIVSTILRGSVVLVQRNFSPRECAKWRRREPRGLLSRECEQMNQSGVPMRYSSVPRLVEREHGGCCDVEDCGKIR